MLVKASFTLLGVTTEPELSCLVIGVFVADDLLGKFFSTKVGSAAACAKESRDNSANTSDRAILQFWIFLTRNLFFYIF